MLDTTCIMIGLNSFFRYALYFGAPQEKTETELVVILGERMMFSEETARLQL